MMSVALAGVVVSVKVLDGLIVRRPDEVAVCPTSAAVTVPVAAPAGMTNVRLVAVALASGAVSVPPACAASEMLAAVAPATRFVPVTVTVVPMVAETGAKLVMVGAGGAAMVSATVPEVAPDGPFWTATVNEPELDSVVPPATWVADAPLRLPFRMVQGAQPGPLIRT